MSQHYPSYNHFYYRFCKDEFFENPLKKYLDIYYKTYYPHNDMKTQSIKIKPVLPPKWKKKQSGYTLVEVIVATSIMATLSSVGLAIRNDQVEYLEAKAKAVAEASNTHNQRTMEVYELLKH
jgi:prepilin-type N-terminal cleavage/methylation domain-containing protein